MIPIKPPQQHNLDENSQNKYNAIIVEQSNLRL